MARPRHVEKFVWHRLPGEQVTKQLSHRERLLLDWDESDHPRDDAGKFTDGGGGGVSAKMRSGDIKGTEPLGGGTNTSLIVTLEHSTAENEYQGVQAVYKPESGETWKGNFANSDIPRFISNRAYSLAEREATAYEVSEALGIGLVPETVLREHVDVDVEHEGGGGHDSGELRERYDSYREKAQDDAMDAVGEQMGEMFHEAKKEHANDLQNRADELRSMWNEVIKDKTVSPAGDREALREHPNLPLGSQQFERRGAQSVIDPIAVLDKAKVDVSYPMNDKERSRAEGVLRDYVAKGHTVLGDVDTSVAEDHLEYDAFVEAHQDTEARMYDSKIKGFEAWKSAEGLRSGSGGGIKNAEAPHPNGGSLQHFRSGASSATYAAIAPEDKAKIAVLDYVLGTMDRHGSNLMFENGHPVMIDNGYTMPAPAGAPDGFTFRSDQVDKWLRSDNRRVPAAVREPIRAKIQSTDWKKVADAHPSMNTLERSAFLGRVANMGEALATDEGLAELWSTQRLY